MTREFRQTSDCMVDFGGVTGMWRLAHNDAPYIITVEEADLNVEQARALRDWLNLVLPDEPSAEPSPCEHLRSELLGAKVTDGYPIFEMRKCLDCEQIFRVRSSLNRWSKA